MKLPILLAISSLTLASLASLHAEDAAPKAESTYPLTTCVVAGDDLGSMGEAYVHIHKEAGKPDREVRFCCKGCLKKFSKDPAKYLAKLDAAAKPAADKAAAPAADAHAGHAH
jgi:hypothetical protein